MRFGQLLREHRLCRAWTQEHLAERSGITPHSISMLESGKRHPRPSSVTRIATALGLDEPERGQLIAAARNRHPVDAGPHDDSADRAERATGTTRAPAEGPDSRMLVPAQLPADLADFTGRAEQIAALTRELAPAGSSGPRAVALVTVTGAGGIGKTSLAVHAAHLLRARFPDGQLYANLRGMSAHPLTPAEVLGRFLRDLGAAPASLLDDTDARAATFRSLLADRRILILLDDAAGAAQVRPLLPGTAECALVVTSRTSLAGLDGAHRVSLRTLAGADAEVLFDRCLGAGALATEPAAGARVLRACAGLPLAIRLATGRLLDEPGLSLGALADRLDDQGRLLDELRLDDRAVRVTLAVGYQRLPVEAARAFALLGLWTGPHLDLEAAAVLLGQDRYTAAALLGTLTGMHLLESTGPARYTFHDLVRAYAAERVRDLPADERTQAVRRLLTWYLHAAASASVALSPGRRPVPLDPPMDAPPTFTDYEAAWAWTDDQYDNLVAAVRLASDLGFTEITCKTAMAMWDAFNIRSTHDDWITVAGLGLTAAQAIDDLSAQARMLGSLGSAHHRADKIDAAAGYLREAAELYHRLNDRGSEAGSRGNLALLDLNRKQYDAAIEQLILVLDIFREVGNPLGEAIALENLGIGYFYLGDFGQALHHFHQSFETHHKNGDQFHTGRLLANVARALRSLGRLEEAESRAAEALALNRTTGSHFGTAIALGTIGDVHAARGRTQSAREYWQEAHAILIGLAQSKEAEEMRDRLDRS